MKTVFITITRGFIARNILRSGVLEILKNKGFRIVVFFTGRSNNLPEYLKKEFEDDNVIIEAVPSISQKGHSLFNKLLTYLVWSNSRMLYSILGNKKKLNRFWFWKYIEFPFLFILGNFHFLKYCARFLERVIFRQDFFSEYFEKYKPCVVFSTSVQSALDINMMKSARKRRIPIVAMPKGWDNITKVLYQVVPDILIVQGECMKLEVARIQRINPDRIKVTGFPQFDFYRKPEIIVSREKFCSWYKLDPNRKIIFFGSEGIWAPDDKLIVSKIVEWVNKKGELSEPSQILIRSHFTDARLDRFGMFRGTPNVVVDDNITISDFFFDGWDPVLEETIKFTNLIYHCDILITVASTLSLDGVCCDKPLINLAFGVLKDPKTGKDISRLLYKQDHCRWLLESNAVDLVYSENQLKKIINKYLINPNRRQDERCALLKNLCHVVDGKSSHRIAEILEDASKF